MFTLVTMAETNANENAISDGIPMTLEPIRKYLQDYYGIPIALREQGVTTVTCPYCGIPYAYNAVLWKYQLF